MPDLINPLINYQKLSDSKKEAITGLSKTIDEIRSRVLKKTLLAWTGDEDDRKRDLQTQINALVKDSVKLTIFGETIYSFDNKLENEDYSYQWSEYILMAARGYQKIYEITADQLDIQEKLWLKMMAIAEFHNSMQHMCASTLTKEAFELLEILSNQFELSNLEKFNASLYKIVLQFFKGDFKEISLEHTTERSDSSYNLIRKELIENKELSLNQILELSNILYVQKSIALFSDYMLRGNEDNLKEAVEQIKKAEELSRDSGRADFMYLSNKLKISFETLRHLSFWNLKNFFELDNEREKELLQSYIKSKIADRYYYIFPSQYEALKIGILKEEHKHTLISMPTGAGKTILAELIIFARIMKLCGKHELTVYMVPSRALARQNYEDFTKTFEKIKGLDVRVCQITGEVVINDEEAVKENDILVVTPEKFDMLLRKQFYNKRVDTLIVDEFHNIRSGFRGMRIQFDIIRQRELYQNTKIVLISAIVSNYSEIKDWLKADIDFRTTWRPTFSRIGIVDITRGDNKIQFNDGSMQIIKIDKPMRGDASIKYSAELATKLSKDGPCMLFSNSKNNRKIGKYTQYLLENIEKVGIDGLIDRKANEFYAQKLFRLVGEEEIYTNFKKGIGIHKGDLPHSIRRIVEEGFKNKALRFLISTTTLAEGVNLPIKTIIIPEPTIQREDMELGLFFNLLGRAGRPNKEYEGQVILIGSSRYPIEKLGKYINATSEDIEAILTPVWRIVTLKEDLDKNNLDLKKRQRYNQELEVCEAILDTLLLAMIHEKKVNLIRDNLDLIQKILIESKTQNKQNMIDRLASVLNESESRLITSNAVEYVDAILQPTDFGKAVYRTGFSPKSCMELLPEITKVIEKVEKKSINRYSIFKKEANILGDIFSFMYVPIETKMFFNNKLPEKYSEIIYFYMMGMPIKELSKKYFRGKVSEGMIQVQGLLSGFCAWFLYAVEILVEYKSLTEDKKDKKRCKYLSTLRLLPEFAYFGTNNDTAIKILKKDISRELLRDDILKLIEILGEKETKRIVENPKIMRKEKLKKQIEESNFQTETSEFIEIFNRVIAKK